MGVFMRIDDDHDSMNTNTRMTVQKKVVRFREKSKQIMEQWAFSRESGTKKSSA